MNGFNYSLKTQLILFFTVFSLGVLAVGSYFTYIHTLNIIKKQNENYLQQQFRQSDYNIRNIMNETDRLSKLFLLDGNIEQFLQTNSYNNTYEVTLNHKAILERISNFISIGDKDSIQIVYYKLKDTNWYLIGEIPLKLFSGDIAVFQRILLLVLVSSIVVIFAVSFFWLKIITKPLNVLAGKMRDMSSGKLGLTFFRRISQTIMA